MPKIVITHDVADVDTWLKFKSERTDAISEMGGRHVVDHVAHDGSNRVAVSAEIDEVEAMLAAIATPPRNCSGRWRGMGSSRLSRYTSSGSRPVATFRRRFSRAMPPVGLGLAARVGHDRPARSELSRSLWSSRARAAGR